VADLAELEERLGVRFDDPSLLERALVHRSYAFEEGGLETNERLEFLGDAVLGLIVTTIIFEELPEAPEGTLAKLRAAAVSTAALAEVAGELELGDHVRLGKGEAASGGAGKESILADTFEAVLAAVHLDRGFDTAAALVRRLFEPRLRHLSGQGAALDYKTSLQELVAARYETVPTYRLEEEGPDHDKRFTATVLVAGESQGRGVGGSKKKAEQAAAREAYRRLIRADTERDEVGDDDGRSKEHEGAGTP
jgi:ribonuclease III